MQCDYHHPQPALSLRTVAPHNISGGRDNESDTWANKRLLHIVIVKPDADAVEREGGRSVR